MESRFAGLGWRILLAGLCASLLLAACGGDDDDDGVDGDAGGEAPAEPISLTVSTHEFKFDAPESVEAGLVEFTVTNEGKQPHMVQLLKLNEGVEFSKAKKALTTDGPPGKIFELAEVAGGVPEIAPGTTAEVTKQLEPGSYALVCFVRGHNLEGMVAPFEVGAQEVSDFAQPEVEGEIRTADFTFVLPDDFSGAGTFQITNAGPQDHEATLFKLDASLEKVQKFLKNPKGPPPGGEPQGVGGVAAQVPGDSSFVEFDLEPGTYVFVCFVPDEKTGKPHFNLGMYEAFEVP